MLPPFPRLTPRQTFSLGATALLLIVIGCHDRPDEDFLVPEAPVIEQGYVGSATCGNCHGPFLTPQLHPTFYDDWLGTAHGKTGINIPSDSTIVADSNGNGVNDFTEGLDLGGFSDWREFTSGGGASGDFAPMLGFDAMRGVYTIAVGSRTFDVEKVIGIGRRQQLYLTGIESSAYVLPALYSVEAATWRAYEPENWYLWNDGNTNGIRDPGEQVTGVLYATVGDTPVVHGRTTDSWEVGCAGCHATGLQAITANPRGEFVAQFAEEGVSCEACHGPGRRHAFTLGGRDLPDRAIVNPRKLSPELYDGMCRSCHSRGFSVGEVAGTSLEFPLRADGTAFLPGQDLAEAFALGEKPNETLHALQGVHVHSAVNSQGRFTSRCQDCHTAHDTDNLSLIRMAIETPSSGVKPVVFTARNQFGDATNGIFTEACEVCHTETKYFRNNASTPFTNHNNGATCTDCHTHRHASGFFSGGGESSGGAACIDCHTTLADRMTSGSGNSYHHHLVDTDATYRSGTGMKNCLSCHVDHDIFRPDLNPFGGRAANLRTNVTVVPTTSAGFTNTDFFTAGAGGICMSCHNRRLAKSVTPPDGTTATPAVPFDGLLAEQIAAYGASVHGGAYTVASTFSGAGISILQANCSKCHNDTLSPKSGMNAQIGTHQFGLHDSTLERMNAPLGAAAVNPLEENFCFRCHSEVDDPIGGVRKAVAGRDWYDVAGMTMRSERIHDVVTGKPNGHAVQTYSGLHTPTEGAAPGWNSGASRHVECADCHNAHAARQARPFDTSGRFAQPLAPTNQVSGPLVGAWGVDGAWPAAWTVPAGSSYTRVEASTHEWQVCLKCHSSYAYRGTPPPGQTDQGLEFNPSNPSYHAVIGASKTTFPPDSSFVGPWTRSSQMACSDCHTSDTKTDPQGPHGSTHDGVLAGPFNNSTGDSGSQSHLCFKCHSYNVYGRDGRAGPASTGFNEDNDENLHIEHAEERKPGTNRRITCTDCHAAVPHGWRRRALLVLDTDPAPYNNGNASLKAADISSWPASGAWRESSCSTVACH